MGAEVISLHIRLPDGCEMRLRGREAWTLDALITAGEDGVTPRERPAPRWSQYVLGLRRRGLEIETVMETHSGPYAGNHGRYVLRTPVSLTSVGYAEGGANAA